LRPRASAYSWMSRRMPSARLGGMAYTVKVRANVETVPVAVLARLKQKLGEIAIALDQVHPASALWDSLRESPMRLHVGGWCFSYDVDSLNRVLVVNDHFEVPT